MAPACVWCSCHSPGLDNGNLNDRTVPALVPAKSIRPDRDKATCVKTQSSDGTSRRI